ncbi:MAG: hypothetical protein HKO03_04510, partial [Acidimicrobiia bacterium]|nr:hypothetical protein [Acidimicrobiia bacterium]
MNPFLKYRRRLDSYRAAMAAGWSDERFVELVERLDEQVAAVSFEGGVATGFRVTLT